MYDIYHTKCCVLATRSKYKCCTLYRPDFHGGCGKSLEWLVFPATPTSPRPFSSQNSPNGEDRRALGRIGIIQNKFLKALYGKGSPKNSSTGGQWACSNGPDRMYIRLTSNICGCEFRCSSTREHPNGGRRTADICGGRYASHISFVVLGVRRSRPLPGRSGNAW